MAKSGQFANPQTKNTITGIEDMYILFPRGPVVDIANPELCELFRGAERAARITGHILKIDPTYLLPIVISWAPESANSGAMIPGLILRSAASRISLDLTSDEEQLLANMHSKTCYNISRRRRLR